MIPQYYEFSCPVKILSGLKALSNLPYELELLGVERPMIVTDKGVVGAGLIKKVKAAFKGSKIEIGAIFDDTPPDSSKKVVNAVAQLFGEENCDGFVAVGGGSSLDTAKCANMIVTEGTDDLIKFVGAERLKKKMKPLIAIPTTAGTGSEVTLVGVIYDEDTNSKLAFTSYKLLPDVAILDPKMTLTMPPKITAATGMDALTHAVEGYYSLQKNPLSDQFSIAAIRLIMENLETCVKNGDDEDARLAMANAALFAGISFSNAMVGAVHSLAHATGGVCHVPHGVANGIYLPWGMELNLDKAGDSIAELAPVLGASTDGDSTEQAHAAIRAIRDLGERLKELCDLPNSLRDAGVTIDKFEEIAKLATNDGSATYNPEDLTFELALDMVKKAY